MKTLRHLRIMAAAVLLLLLGCRQEITTIDDHNSKREQEFFRDAQEKTTKLGNGNFVIDLLKKENEKTHFVTRLKDQTGLPVWDKITLTGSSNTNKINTSDTLTVVIPLSEDKEYLSSLLIAKVANGGIIQIKNIDNTDLYRYVNDSSVPAYKRETALLNFIYADHKVFGTKYYINIPADLFPDIELRTGESKKRMNIVSISEEDISSFAVPIRICVTREDVCGHCSGTVILGYKTECFTYIGEYTDGGSGEDGGSGDTSGDTGGGGGSPGSGSSECEKGGWYRVVPPGCPNGDDLPVVVQNLKNRLLSYGEQYDIYLYEPYLASNLTVAEKFGAYLTQNNNAQGAAFVMWGLEFLSQNTSTTWAQFERIFLTPKVGNDGGDNFSLSNYSNYQTQQYSLPKFSQVNSKFPRDPNNPVYGMPSNQVYQLVGGQLYNSHLSNPNNYNNACAIRISRALNYSGQPIPIFTNNSGQQKSEKGSDNLNYILTAEAMLANMLKTYPAPTYQYEGSDLKNVYDQIKGKNGIYIIIPNVRDELGASGHADLFYTNDCLVGGCHLGLPSGGKVYFWQLFN